MNGPCSDRAHALDTWRIHMEGEKVGQYGWPHMNLALGWFPFLIYYRVGPVGYFIKLCSLNNGICLGNGILTSRSIVTGALGSDELRAEKIPAITTADDAGVELINGTAEVAGGSTAAAMTALLVV
ncbi:hypothetical protein D5086_002417 [Populus alba]|uniref:Uncharacterized protein n=1 Tax=Populus alba TaxID=43335 RepID=A0ACC4D2M9_POPAL